MQHPSRGVVSVVSVAWVARDRHRRVPKHHNRPLTFCERVELTRPCLLVLLRSTEVLAEKKVRTLRPSLESYVSAKIQIIRRGFATYQ